MQIFNDLLLYFNIQPLTPDSTFVDFVYWFFSVFLAIFIIYLIFKLFFKSVFQIGRDLR